jgi:hypothetical protein
MRGSGGRWWYNPTLVASKKKRWDQTLFRPCFTLSQFFLAREVLLKKATTYPHFRLGSGVVLALVIALVRSGGAVLKWG